MTSEQLSRDLAKRPSDIVLLHVANGNDYEKAHIPGARKFTYRALVGTRDSVQLELPEPDVLRATFEALGVSDSSVVVVYAHEGPMATRALLSLASLGHARYALLDGGLTGWQARGGHVERTTPATFTPGRMTARPRAEVTVTAEWITPRVGRPGVSLIDTRTTGECDGTGNRSGMPSAGHLEGARQLEWQKSFSDDLTTLKSRAELEQLYASRVTSGDIVVTYCWVGDGASLRWRDRRDATPNASTHDHTELGHDDAHSVCRRKRAVHAHPNDSLVQREYSARVWSRARTIAGGRRTRDSSVRGARCLRSLRIDGRVHASRAEQEGRPQRRQQPDALQRAEGHSRHSAEGLHHERKRSTRARRRACVLRLQPLPLYFFGGISTVLIT